MALDSLTFKATVGLSITAQKNITGSDYSPIQNTSTITKAVNLGTSSGNATAGGADECASFIQSIAASGSASIDLTSLTDFLAATGVSLARVKSITIRLLSAADDSAVGTAAGSITIDNTVTNALSSQSNSGWFSNAAEGAANGSKFTIPNGAYLSFGVANAAGVVVDSTHKLIKVTNNDGSLSAKVQFTLTGGTS
jgi:hypothetical protein